MTSSVLNNASSEYQLVRANEAQIKESIEIHSKEVSSLVLMK